MALLLVAGLGLAFFSLAWLGITMTREMGRIAAVWLANGVAVAVILRSPPKLLPSLLGGVLFANLAANIAHADPLFRAIALSLCNLLEIGIVVAIVRPYLHPAAHFDSGPVIGRFLLAALAGAMASAGLAAGILSISEDGAFGVLFVNWFVADLLGLLIVGSLLLSLPARGALRRRSYVTIAPAVLIEQAFFMAAILGATVALFLQDVAPLLFLLGPLLVFSAFRLSLMLATFAILLSSAIAIAATHFGFGPMARLAGEPLLKIYALQALIASMIALVLPVRALIVERDRLGAAFASTERKFMRIAEASTAGILHLDLGGQVTWANNRWSELTGEAFVTDHGDRWMNAVAPEAQAALVRLWTEVRATMSPLREEFPASDEAKAREHCD